MSRKEAVKRLEEKIEEYNKANKQMVNLAEYLYLKRMRLKQSISNVEMYINLLANTPKEINAVVGEIRISLDNYQDLLDGVEKEMKKADTKSGISAGAGVAAGIGVAAFAPTAAMGIATTFGVASTGTAISALSGAAATNAALAWLGGGALTAGGAGMAGGSLLLALAGPVGWTIGGASLLGSALFLRGKNKKIENEANEQAVQVETQTKIQLGLSQEIKNLTNETLEHKKNLDSRLDNARNYFPHDYNLMDVDQRFMLGVLVNSMQIAVASLIKGVGK